MQGVLVRLVSQIFAHQADIDVTDRLAIHRFTNLRDKLNDVVVPYLLSEAMADGFGDYVTQALTVTLAAKWHASGTCKQVCPGPPGLFLHARASQHVSVAHGTT